ncbi:MAG: hypothetical protein HW419_4738 [Deltaproteobacteria bacterium]|nr:hypothetical protein [Deltaproteobacteria bacterium]
MVTEERNKQLSAAIQKDESKIAIAAAFKQFRAEFTNAETAVHMRLAKTLHQVAKSQQALNPFVSWQLPQSAQDRGIDGEDFIQASL